MYYKGYKDTKPIIILFSSSISLLCFCHLFMNETTTYYEFKIMNFAKEERTNEPVCCTLWRFAVEHYCTMKWSVDEQNTYVGTCKERKKKRSIITIIAISTSKMKFIQKRQKLKRRKPLRQIRANQRNPELTPLQFQILKNYNLQQMIIIKITRTPCKAIKIKLRRLLTTFVLDYYRLTNSPAAFKFAFMLISTNGLII